MSLLVIVSFYFIASAFTFIAYALDKSAARNQRWRVSENTLHLCSLIGGWPGALAAQRFLRHKSNKASFQRMFWMTVAINAGAIAWLEFSPAAHYLR